MLRAAARRLARLPLGAVVSDAAPLAGLSLTGSAALQQQLGAEGSSTLVCGSSFSNFSSRSLGSSSTTSRKADGSSGSSGGGHAAPPTPAQAAAADRLLKASREASQHRSRAHSTDEELRQRILLLLQLGLSEAAIDKHIQQHGGGPYVAWETLAELVALLRRERFSQKQLDGLLTGGGTSGATPFRRAPADVAANLRWLRETFGLTRDGAALACSRVRQLLVYSVPKLQANRDAIAERRRLPTAAMGAVATALRQGNAEFLIYEQQTVRKKEEDLQALLGLSDERVSARYGRLAQLFGCNIPGLKPRLQLLLELTGLPLDKLGPGILRCPALLYIKEETVRNTYHAILAAVGSESDAKLLISRNPLVLASGERRVALNLQTLREPPFGCSPDAAVAVLLKNPRLGELDLEQLAVAARLAFFQQAYACTSPEEALLKCADMMHRDLRRVAPRVAYWRDQHPGRTLPTGSSTFTVGDETFCRKHGFQLTDFQAFKQRWLASEEGREVCRHEGSPPHRR